MVGPAIPKPPSYTERLANWALLGCRSKFRADQDESRRHGFPSWSWAGWFGPVKVAARHEAYLLNTHGLQIKTEDFDGQILDWEDLCHPYTAEARLAVAKPLLHAEGNFIKVSLLDSTVNPPTVVNRARTQRSIWYALLQREDKSQCLGRFSFTSERRELLQSSRHHLTTTSRSGLILGQRIMVEYPPYQSVSLKGHDTCQNNRGNDCQRRLKIGGASRACDLQL